VQHTDGEIDLRLFRELRDALLGQQATHQHRASVRSLAVAIEYGCEREQHRPVLGQDDALVALTDGNRGQKRVPGVETGRIQERIVQRRVHVGVVTLAPDVTTFAIEERDQLDAGRVQERRVHIGAMKSSLRRITYS
jgi:hypothetical protein